MSGPQHIQWFEAARQETGRMALLDLQVAMPKDQDGWSSVREALIEMSRGKSSDE